MPQPAIIITGANGQLGMELKMASCLHYPQFEFIFLSKDDLPIDESAAVEQYFKKQKPAFCINCAAYTAVDKAETERDTGNACKWQRLPGLLAAVCKSVDCRFIHISTDYVFDGTSAALQRNDATNPVNYYGGTKIERGGTCIERTIKTAYHPHFLGIFRIRE